MIMYYSFLRILPGQMKFKKFRYMITDNMTTILRDILSELGIKFEDEPRKIQRVS